MKEPFKYSMMSAFVFSESGPISSPASAGGSTPRMPAARMYSVAVRCFTCCAKVRTPLNSPSVGANVYLVAGIASAAPMSFFSASETKKSTTPPELRRSAGLSACAFAPVALAITNAIANTQFIAFIVNLLEFEQSVCRAIRDALSNLELVPHEFLHPLLSSQPQPQWPAIPPQFDFKVEEGATFPLARDILR